MKIKIIHEVDGDGYERQEMEIDGKEVMYVAPLCESPEDAIIGRDLVSCDRVASLMRKAYEAAKRGEEFSVEVIEEE
jgi:hypothetical protein